MKNVLITFDDILKKKIEIKITPKKKKKYTYNFVLKSWEKNNHCNERVLVFLQINTSINSFIPGREDTHLSKQKDAGIFSLCFICCNKASCELNYEVL